MTYKRPINQICEHCDNYWHIEGGGGFYYVCEHLGRHKDKPSGTREIDLFKALSEKFSLENWHGKQVSLGLEEKKEME